VIWVEIKMPNNKLIDTLSEISESEEKFKDLIRDKAIQEAIYLASPVLFEETDDIECKLKKYLFKKSLQIMYFTIEKKGNINILKNLFTAYD
jgi:hypothetical protein